MDSNDKIMLKDKVLPGVQRILFNKSRGLVEE